MAPAKSTELDLDDKMPPWNSGSTKQAALKEITIICGAELTRTQLYPRTEKAIRRILEAAEKGLTYG